MTEDELVVLANGVRMGRVLRHRRRNVLRLVYDDDWMAEPESHPLSLSLPLSAGQHGDDRVEPFLWGLLPDDREVIVRWAERYSVSPGNVFRLLEHVGEDCAGAIQFVLPERVAAVTKAGRRARTRWLSEAEMGQRMELLVRDHSASRTGDDVGRFSLAGAQPKTALFYDATKRCWGVPSGTTPTTHVLKPATGRFAGFAFVEHFCQELASYVGLAAARSSVQRFGDVEVLVSERYDRVRRGRTVLRVHQEDLCQALGRPPRQKYQSDGGPSTVEIAALLRSHSASPAADLAQFFDALVLHWVLLGTDAHAKNYSVLHAGGGRVRLAPLYDLASALPYPQQMPIQKLKLAMKVGGEYRVRALQRRHWEREAVAIGLEADSASLRMRRLLRAIPENARAVRERLGREGLRHEVVDRLVEALAVRCPELEKGFGGAKA